MLYEEVRRAPNSKGSDKQEPEQEVLQQSHWLKKVATRVRRMPREEMQMGRMAKTEP